MKTHRRIVVASLLLLAVAGCGPESQRNLASKAAWPLSDTPTMPAEIKVESATIFYCNNVRCQLLGVTEYGDAELRKQALDFSRRWFEDGGKYIIIHNDTNPLKSEDGTCVVWIRGGAPHITCLNTELVRAGLVNVNYSSLLDYNFMMRGKAEDHQSIWRQQLDEAADDYKKGVKPKVYFDWLPKEDQQLETEQAR